MVKEWTVFINRCLDRRVQADLFDAATAQLHRKSPLPGRKLAALLLRPRSAGASSVDPRVIIYLERLLALKKVDASDVLSATFCYSKDRLPKNGEDSSEKEPKWSNSPELEEVVCHRLHKAFATEDRPINNTEGVQTLIVVTRWMQAVVTSHTSDTMMQAMAGISQQPPQHSINIREALGVLAIGLIENTKILLILNHPTAKGTLLHGNSKEVYSATVEHVGTHTYETQMCVNVWLNLWRPSSHSYLIILWALNRH